MGYTGMTGIFFELLSIFLSGSQLVSLPGKPVDLFPSGDSVLVLCSEPGYLCSWSGDDTVEILEMDLMNPAGICLWNGEPAVSDPGAGRIVLMNRSMEISGGPAGICQVEWFPDSTPSLAVCLNSQGSVVLVNRDGLITTLGEFPGARGIASGDFDLDGDSDLCVSCCGSGIYLVENRDGIPFARVIGNISQGVKRVSVSDIDRDGLMDIAGIACSIGGVGWWRNPGDIRSDWPYKELNSLLQGPKGIWSSGDSVAVASLHSSVFFNFSTEFHLPQGFTSVCITPSGMLIAGHSLGLLTAVQLD